MPNFDWTEHYTETLEDDMKAIEDLLPSFDYHRTTPLTPDEVAEIRITLVKTQMDFAELKRSMKADHTEIKRKLFQRNK